VRPAAPVKVASAEVLALVGACGWPSEIWVIALTTEVHSCGWPSEIWLTTQATGVDVVGGVVVGLEMAAECDEGDVVGEGDDTDVADLGVEDEIGVVKLTGCGEVTALLQKLENGSRDCRTAAASVFVSALFADRHAWQFP
jgi:hypothetical protein